MGCFFIEQASGALFCEREFPYASPQRVRTTPQASTKAKKRRISPADHPKPPKRQDRPSEPQHHSWKDPSRPRKEASRDRLFKAAQEAERVAPPINKQTGSPAIKRQPPTPQAMADGALMAAPSPPQQSTTPEQARSKAVVPPTPSRLKWFGSQITEDNLNVDYVSNSLREEDRKPEISQRPRPQPLSKLTSWLGWSRSTINDDESSQSSPKRSASPSFFKSFRRSQSPTHDDTSDKSSNTHGSNQDLEFLAAQEAALEKAGGAAVEQGHKLQHYCRGPRPDACHEARGKLDWYDFLADTELCTMHFDALEGDDAMKLNIVLRLLENCKVPSTLKLSPATLKAFAGDVWQDMHPHPYHNFSHATDVAQSFYSILIATRLVKSLDAITVATAVLAALCHDLDHPGYTNQYQENERTEFWLRHKESCLENHHYERFERLLQIHNITTSLDRVKFLGRRMILATDMKQHDRIMSEIREKISKGDDLLEDDASVALLLGLILKCADISNQARPRHIAAKWNDRVYQEFYREGDQDRKRGRQVLNLHDRHKNDTNSSSVGFIGFVVVPLYKLLGKAILEVENKHQFGLRTRIVDECLVVLNANKERYGKIANGEEVEDAPVFDVEAVVTPPGINGEHQQNSVKFFNYRAGHATPQEGVEAHFRAREGSYREDEPVRRTPSPIVEIAARSAASIRSSLRLIRPPSRESLVFFAEEAARAEAEAS